MSAARWSDRLPASDAMHTRRSLPSWMREPLLHFVASRQDDPRTIVVGADVDREATAVFKASRGRAPTPQELTALRNVWLDNEVLYREGLALQVDKGDTAIRERVIFKALSVIDASVRLPPVDDATLQAWFEQHRVKYDEPVRFDYQEAVLSGDTSEAAVRSFAAALNAGTPGDAKAGLRVFKDRPLGNLVQSYGEGFADALKGSPPGIWEALPSRDGWRTIRLDVVRAPRPAVLANLRADVLQDWTDAVMSEQRSAAVHALATKYRIRDEATKP